MVEDVSLRPRFFRFWRNSCSQMRQVMLPRFADSYILTALRCLAGFVCGLLLCLSFTWINTAVNKRLETTRSFLSPVDRPAPRIADRNPHGRTMNLPLENVSLGSAGCGSQAEPRSLAVPKKRLRLTLFAAMRLDPSRREVYLRHLTPLLESRQSHVTAM